MLGDVQPSFFDGEPDAKFVSYPLWEIDVPARACEEVLKVGWPITHKAFVDNGRVAP